MHEDNFFAQNKDNKKWCENIQKMPQAESLAMEHQTANEFSPGPVRNEENLCRHLLSPVHFDDESGDLKPTAYEDAARQGMSVNRLKYLNLDGVLHLARERVQRINLNPPRTGNRSLIGYAIFSAEEVRSIYSNEVEAETPVRGYAVYDTAKADDLSHGDVCQLVSEEMQKRKVRMEIFQMLKGRFVKIAA